MAKLAGLFLLLLLAISVVATSASHWPKKLKLSKCPKECVRRCTKARTKKPCLFYCNKCCRKCLCVPPGYSGNKVKCGPCYNNWKTKRGGPKCP